MKASPSLVATFKEWCEPLNTESNRAAYRDGKFPRAELTKDVNVRFRWDIFHAANRTSEFKLTELARDEELNSDHIDTALKKIIPAL